MYRACMAFAARAGHVSHTSSGAAQSESHAVSRVMLSPAGSEKPDLMIYLGLSSRDLLTERTAGILMYLRRRS